MPAEQYGARLLDEVREESLEQFLAELRHLTVPQPRDVLGVETLDVALEAHRHPAPLTPTLHRSAWTSPPAPSPDHDGAPPEGDDGPGRRPRPSAPWTSAPRATVELTSKTGSGKTTLLYYLCAKAVLPPYVGGKEGIAVYLDLDGRFSATRLEQVMRHCAAADSIPAASVDQSGEAAGPETTSESMRHVYVYRPQSSRQFLAIVTALPSFLLSGARHASGHRSLRLLAVDSADAFHWQDRFDRDMTQVDDSVASRGPPTAGDIIDALKKLQDRFACTVVFSTTTTPPLGDRLHQHSHTAHTPRDASDLRRHTAPSAPPAAVARVSPWSSYATLTLSLSPAPVLQFAPHMTMDECLHDREKRFDVVRARKFRVHVHGRTGQANLLSRETLGGAAGLAFRVDEAGLEFG